MQRKTLDAPCLCGRPLSLEGCCLPVIQKSQEAITAEDLMRSRYTAFALKDVDYLVYSHKSPQGFVDAEAIRAGMPGTQWIKLEIVGTKEGQAADVEGEVSFYAHYNHDGEFGVVAERSRFGRLDGRWVYLDGTLLDLKTGCFDAAKETQAR